MKYNMNFYDIGLRYVMGYLVVMLGFLTQQVWLMALGIPFILIGLMGICPLFKILGIDHNNFEDHHSKVMVDPTSKTRKDTIRKIEQNAMANAS